MKRLANSPSNENIIFSGNERKPETSGNKRQQIYERIEANRKKKNHQNEQVLFSQDKKEKISLRQKKIASNGLSDKEDKSRSVSQTKQKQQEDKSAVRRAQAFREINEEGNELN